MDDRLDIQSILRALGMDDEQIEEWMNTPLEIFNDQTPAEVIGDGKYDTIKAKLICLIQGNVGM